MEWKGILAKSLALDEASAGQNLWMLASSGPSGELPGVGTKGVGHQVETCGLDGARLQSPLDQQFSLGKG